MQSDVQDISALKEFALHFRNAIEQCDLDELSIGFRKFPRGACGDTSLLLATALKKHGFGPFRFVCGFVQLGNVFESHAWLVADGIIVDITGDQFEGRPPVFVGSDPEWYDTWEDQVDAGEADFRVGNAVTASELERSYAKITSNL